MRPFPVVFALLLATFAACSSEDGDATPTPFAGGSEEIVATYGSIDYTRQPPVVDSDYVLESMKCDAGTLTMVTSSGTFTGSMDCTAMPPDLVIAGFGNKQIVITITTTRLKIEAVAVGTLDLPAAGARLEDAPNDG